MLRIWNHTAAKTGAMPMPMRPGHVNNPTMAVRKHHAPTALVSVLACNAHYLPVYVLYLPAIWAGGPMIKVGEGLYANRTNAWPTYYKAESWACHWHLIQLWH